MLKFISPGTAFRMMLILLIAVLLFHALVWTQVIPYSIVWAGRISSPAEMKKLEFISILINVVLILVLFLRASYNSGGLAARLLTIMLWVFVIFFGLNTVGNLFAKSPFELYVFTTLSFISFLLCLRIVTATK